jgi:MFS family permease
VSDQQLLYLAAFVRALATGLIGVLLGVYLGEIGLDAAAIGLIVSVGPAGAASATFVVTFLGDRLGHRRVLLGVTLLSARGQWPSHWAPTHWSSGRLPCSAW